MKLNPNCFRDVLLFLEENLKSNPMDNLNSYTQLLNSLKNKYSVDDIEYTVKKLKEENMIVATINYASNKIYTIFITDITTIGYDALNKIRSDKVWKKVLKRLGQNASTIISIIQLASSFR